MSAICLFGFHFGPVKEDAQAKVFERLLFYTKDMPKYLFDDEITSEPRKVIVNDITTHISIGKTGDDVNRVLDFYAQQYEPQPVEIIDEDILEDVDDEELGECIEKIVSFMECMRSFQHFRLERKHYGFWSAFEFHDPGLKIGSREFAEKIKSAAETGALGKLGTSRIVIALRNMGMEKTTIINMWTDRDLNINNLMPDAFGDMPGKDIDDVPRYPGSRRQLSIEQENSRTIDSLVVYEGEGSLATNILFYHSRMEDAGWKAAPSFEDLMKKESRENLLFYTRKGRECTIQINEDEGTGRMITTVMDRKTI
jgi:hypothetical protein